MTSVLESPGSATQRLVTLPEGEPELTLGWEAALWAEKWLIQPNGPKGGQPFHLIRSQLRFLLWWYALDADGRWLYRHGVRRLAKGSGKSPFAAVLALIEFCAPVRVRDFDPGAPGGVIGKPVDMPLVQIAATAESQTANTMRMVRAFCSKSSPVAQAHGIDVGKTKYYKNPEGTLEIITSSSTAAEGAEGSFTIADETEWWKPGNGGVDLAETLQDNLAKSGSRMLETSNAWVPGQDSVAESTWDAWVAQEEGRTKGETKILYDARIAPPDTNVYDTESLTAALLHVQGDCDWMDVRDRVERIQAPNARLNEMRRKHLNQPSVAEDAWVDPDQWNRLAAPDVRIADDAELVAFFDGSKSRDATAFVLCDLASGHVFLPGVWPNPDGIWEPDPSHDSDETVDAADVDRVVQNVFERYPNIVAFFADVREWESFALTEWPGRYKDRLEVWAAPSARPPQPIAWDMRSHANEFAKAAEACYDEIVESAELVLEGLPPKFTHSGDLRMARHVGNARRNVVGNAVSIGKASPSSPNKIDAAVCVIGARMLRRLVLASPRKKKRSGVVW